MQKKLFRLALFSAPILATYGVAPIYLFTNQNPYTFIISDFFLSILIFLFWVINIYLIDLTEKPYKRYVLSYVFTTLLHYFIILIIPTSPIYQNPLFFLTYPLIALLAINTFILIIINVIVLQYQKESAEMEIRNLKVSNLEAQKQMLLQQLQPHFLFNALSTLKSLIRENPNEAEHYTLKLSDFLRYSVQAPAHDLVSLAEELQFTQDYIALQKMRFGEALQYHIDLPDIILAKKIPVYALQTLVENAIKHNAFTEKKPLFIKIQWEEERLKISNNKLFKQLVPESGTGLNNLNQRYKILMNKEIEIINNKNEFMVYINLL
ncbi:MAG: sensor histidine kinase [Saprospiraceae bacterium]